MNKRKLVTDRLKGVVMGDVIIFNNNAVKKPESFWVQFKRLIRKYHTPADSERIIAAILDTECYEMTDEHIRKAADLYFMHAPERSV